LVCAWIGFLAILIFSPDVYAQTLGLGASDARTVELAFVAALSILIGLLSLGVLRRWRWIFWLILIAFLLGAVRIPASVLQLFGVLPATGPAWYEVLQGIIGAAQFVIALAMLAGYRKAGPWGDFV
jgi:Na+(H+)/acetate symporter ActP